jgi:hypothetical protein
VLRLQDKDLDRLINGLNRARGLAEGRFAKH